MTPAKVILKYTQTTNCKGEPFKKFYKSPQCANCDAEVGFYRETCPNCGATLDRKNVERMAVNGTNRSAN
jgi:predicted amidophosphoribosyltransferase